MAHGRGDDGLSRITTRNASARGQHWSLELIISRFLGVFCLFISCFIFTPLVLLGKAGRQSSLLSLGRPGINLFKASKRSLPGSQTITTVSLVKSILVRRDGLGGLVGWEAFCSLHWQQMFAFFSLLNKPHFLRFFAFAHLSVWLSTAHGVASWPGSPTPYRAHFPLPHALFF